MTRSLLLAVLSLLSALTAMTANAQSRQEYGPYTCDYCFINSNLSPQTTTVGFINSIVSSERIDIQPGDYITVCDEAACGVYEYNGHGAYELKEIGPNDLNSHGWGGNGFDPIFFGPGGPRTTNGTCFGPGCGNVSIGQIRHG